MPIQKRVSELPAVTGITGSDMLIMSSSSATKRVTFSQITAYLQAVGIPGATGPAGSGEAYQSPTAPAQAAASATWFDTTTGQYFVRYDGAWVEVGGKHYA
jgi:hypothetical protein